MDNKALIGISILLFTYGLFSWAIGRFINKRKKKESTEFQNFLLGAGILGIILIALIAYLYWG